jgi:hypothetical protein
MGIAFLPVDIDVRLPDENRLHEYCEKHKIVTSTNDSHSWWWNVIPVLVRGAIDTPEQLNDVLANRYNAGVGTPRYVNNIDKEFPEIPYMLAQLPFKELTVVVMLEQKEQVDYHTDGYNNDYIFIDPSELAFELEPKRYNILLTKHDYQECFFIADQPGGKKVYPDITKERPCHVIADRYYAHGANYRGPGKIMLAVIGGILDRDKHLELINKNKQDAIIFPDPQ